MSKRKVFVNATSLASGGALTILNQYINELHMSAKQDEIYYVFIPDTCKIKYEKENIVFITNSKNEYYKNKIYWNSFGMKKWCSHNEIWPDELYSMQNYYPFGFSEKNIVKKLYLHQPIPFYEYNWNYFKKEERELWFYKYIYWILIKKSIAESDKIIVQTEWMKQRIVDKLKIDAQKIVIERPVIKNVEAIKYQKNEDLTGKIKLFYPASEVIYKNHKVLYKAMDVLVNQYNRKDIVLYLTLDKANEEAQKYIERFKLKDNIVLTGKLAYQEVMSFYASIDMLVFPSKIETFGLPLVEVQSFEVPIVAADLQLYREVIGEYKRPVRYCNVDDHKQWADAINGFYRQ